MWGCEELSLTGKVGAVGDWGVCVLESSRGNTAVHERERGKVSMASSYSHTPPSLYHEKGVISSIGPAFFRCQFITRSKALYMAL